MQASLQSVLAEKKRELDRQAPEWEKQTEKWLETIECLYKEITGWIKPLEAQKYLSIAYADIAISEALLRRYHATKMTITFFNNQKIVLVPVGLHVIGAEGRIDMAIGDRTLMIVRVPGDVAWTFAEREGRGKIKRWAFNEDTFTEILTEYAECF